MLPIKKHVFIYKVAKQNASSLIIYKGFAVASYGRRAKYVISTMCVVVGMVAAGYLKRLIKH